MNHSSEVAPPTLNPATPRMDISDLRAHLGARIAASTLIMFPFPHIIIEDVFPDTVYQDILNYNPFAENAGQPWLSRARRSLLKGSTPYDKRKQINLHKPQQRVEGHPDSQAFWKAIAETFLCDSWFIKTVIQFFPTYFDLRFGEIMTKADACSLFERQLFLQRHEEEFVLGAHTDIATRIFTCIFSYATETGYEAYGTRLLRPRDEFIRCWGDAHHSEKDFDLVETAPYAPNTAFLFFKTRHSFHSVAPLSQNIPNQRYGMQFQCYEPRGGLFTDLSRPNIMRDNHNNVLGRIAEQLYSLMWK